MNVWMINPYGAAPDEAWTPYRFTMAARALARRGHTVTWWTSCFSHHRKVERAQPWEEKMEGDRFRVRFVPTTGYRRNVSLRRFLSEATFAVRTYRRAVRMGERPDVIVAADPPQASGLAATLLGRRFRAPVVLDCLDLWPEMFTRVLPAPLRPLGSLALFPFHAIRRLNFSRAAAVIYSAQTYRDALADVARGVRQEVIPIGVDAGEPPGAAAARPRKALAAVYAGTLGEAYDLETLLAAAEILAGRGAAASILVFGEGPLRERIEAAAARPGTLVRYGGAIAPAELRSRYQEMDVGLLPYAAGSTVASPVKLYDYLGAGLPVVTSLGGEVRDLLESSGTGRFYRAGDPADLARTLGELTSDPARLNEMSARAAALGKTFDAGTLYERYAALVENVAGVR